MDSEVDRDSFRFATLKSPSTRRDSEIAPTAMRGCINFRLTDVTCLWERIPLPDALIPANASRFGDRSYRTSWVYRFTFDTHQDLL